ASLIVLLSFLVKPHADAACGKHQHPIERVHELLQSLHWNSPFSELGKLQPNRPAGSCEVTRVYATLRFPPSKSIMLRAPIHIVKICPLYIKTAQMPRSCHRRFFLVDFSAKC